MDPPQRNPRPLLNLSAPAGLNPVHSFGRHGPGISGFATLEAAQGAPREPRRDSRGERSPWLPLETNTSFCVYRHGLKKYSNKDGKQVLQVNILFLCNFHHEQSILVHLFTICVYWYHGQLP